MSLTPIVLHCSAGVGRTGSLVLIELVLEKLLCKQTCSNMGRLLTEIRKQRAHLIQNEIVCISLGQYFQKKNFFNSKFYF